jgi:hypothetical protein
VLASAIVISACGGGGKHDAAKPRKPAPTVIPQGKLKLVLGVVDVQDAGPAAKLPDSVRRIVLRTTQTYLDSAVLSPLERRGFPTRAYQQVFDPFVRSDASKRDRAALTESPAPPTRGVVNGRASPLRLDALGDQAGKVALIAATFTLDLKASTPVGPLAISRLTELTFQNEFGRWKVAAYRVTVRRSVGKKTTTTTAVTSGPVGAKGAAS